MYINDERRRAEHRGGDAEDKEQNVEEVMRGEV
jgi:hypothetical protein